AGVESFDQIQTFQDCKQKEGKSVSSYVHKMKGYVEQLECLSYVLSQDLSVGLILNGLTSDFAGLVRNYNMHNMGKTMGELHALLIEYEKGLPKKAATPQIMASRGGRIQKANKKSRNAKGKGKGKGKGNDKSYISKPKNPKPSAKEHPTKNGACHHCKEVGHWKKNCSVYLAELMKNKKQVGTASSLGIFTIGLFSFPNKSWVYDTGCGTHICITKQGLKGARKLEQAALYLYIGNGVRAQVEAIGRYDLVLPNGLVIYVSRQGASYFITFTDDYSLYGYVYLLKHKHEVFETFKVFKNEVENQLGKTIKALRSDRGGKYISQEFKDYLKACRIVQQLTPPYTPQHNDVSERRNHTFVRHGSIYDESYKHCSLSLLGLALESSTTHTPLVSNQKALVKQISPDRTPTKIRMLFEKNLITQEVSGRAIDLEEIQDEDTSPSEIISEIPMEVKGFEPPKEEEILICRSERSRRVPNRLCLNVEAEEHNLRDLNEHTSYKAAMLDPESNKWLDAMNAEMQSMIDNMVWVLVDLPPNFKTVRKKLANSQRSIYGLKQASRSWNKRFDEEIKKFGFAQNLDEPCVYQKASRSNVTFLILYVDDIIIMGNHIPSLQSVKDYLGKCFAMKDLGEATFILGIKIYRDRSKRLIGLSQSAYMDKILKRYKMDNSKRGHIPMQERLDLNKTQGASTPEEVKRMQNVPYASAVGSIMYVVRCTRPDVAFAQNITSRFQQNPEAEYIAASKAAMEAVWIRNFILRVGIVPTINEPIKMFCDNSATLHFSNEPGVQRGARHYHRRYHYVCESIVLGEIKFLKVHTDDNLADPFTKALPKGKLTQHARSMGLRLASSFM
ncbi:retrotransposon protein, putative, ty1-copia subclass, partial [Tanacetum coccineum]